MRDNRAYQQRNATYLKKFMLKLNQIPKDVLFAAAKEAFMTAVEETHQDSGNAAWHWTFTGLRAMERSDPRMDFSVKYGMSPIGQRGDKGANSGEVTANTIAHGLEVLRRMIYDDGRKAVALANNIDNKYYQANANINVSARVLTRRAHEAARKAMYSMNRGY